MRKLLPVVLFFGFGCAASTQQRAYVVGKASKEVLDTSYVAWDKLANARVSSCEDKLTPAEDFTKSDYDECVGPFNENVQQKIVTALEIVRDLQLALFIVLAQDKSDTEVRKALADLQVELVKFIALIQENR